MALPMDEQRILEEMERMLAADDPRLAARLAAFGQPGIGQSLRTRRARAALSVLVLVLIAAVAAVIYLMSSLRLGSPAHSTGQRQAQHSSAPPSRPAAHQAARHVSAGRAAPAGHLSGHFCAATFCRSGVQPASLAPGARHG